MHESSIFSLSLWRNEWERTSWNGFGPQSQVSGSSLYPKNADRKKMEKLPGISSNSTRNGGVAQMVEHSLSNSSNRKKMREVKGSITARNALLLQSSLFCSSESRGWSRLEAAWRWVFRASFVRWGVRWEEVIAKFLYLKDKLQRLLTLLTGGLFFFIPPSPPVA